VAPSSAFAAADICIWKDGSATQKASAAGITVTSPFDSIVGLHLVEIDTSNNTDTGFWTSGSVYTVRIVTAKTVATYSVSGLLIGEFSLEVQTADVRKFGGTAGAFGSGRPEVNVTHIGGDAQSATDLKDFADAGYDPSTNKLTGAAVLDSASRLAIWNTLTTETFTADSFGELLLISDGTNGRAVKVTGANHIAADVHDCQADGLSGSTEIGNIQDAAGWLLAISSGAVANPQTATEQYDITQFGVNYRVAMAGLTSTGTRTAPTLSKPA
jgi:hypothetical protein